MTTDKVAGTSSADIPRSIFRYSIMHSCSLVILFRTALYIVMRSLNWSTFSVLDFVGTIATLYLHSLCKGATLNNTIYPCTFTSFFYLSWFFCCVFPESFHFIFSVSLVFQARLLFIAISDLIFHFAYYKYEFMLASTSSLMFYIL